ncbi:MAG TPA: isoprenylcysteine carboxylmethyltransferase family protein [Clostridiaceae bacterium]|nr:isoprenylcysteine carboxylmethyltransferase family protein [Clostridiaceae bacterium]
MYNKQHLPMRGVGPFYVAVCMIMTAVCILLERRQVLIAGDISQWSGLMIVLGCILVIGGIGMWAAAILQAKIDKHILNNQLVTAGIYAWVRNPIYVAFNFIFTGIIFLFSNLFLLILPLIFWALLTVLMKHTEERWLLALYGEAYVHYCKNVNRCIPWWPKHRFH